MCNSSTTTLGFNNSLSEGLKRCLGMGWDGRCFPSVCVSIVALFYILLISVALFSTSAFNLSNTKLRISFASNYLSSHIAVSLSRMKALLLKRMLHKNLFLITFITSTLKKSLIRCCWCRNHCFTSVCRCCITL